MFSTVRLTRVTNKAFDHGENSKPEKLEISVFRVSVVNFRFSLTQVKIGETLS